MEALLRMATAIPDKFIDSFCDPQCVGLPLLFFRVHSVAGRKYTAVLPARSRFIRKNAFLQACEGRFQGGAGSIHTMLHRHCDPWYGVLIPLCAPHLPNASLRRPSS